MSQEPLPTMHLPSGGSVGQSSDLKLDIESSGQGISSGLKIQYDDMPQIVPLKVRSKQSPKKDERGAITLSTSPGSLSGDIQSVSPYYERVLNLPTPIMQTSAATFPGGSRFDGVMEESGKVGGSRIISEYKPVLATTNESIQVNFDSGRRFVSNPEAHTKDVSNSITNEQGMDIDDRPESETIYLGSMTGKTYIYQQSIGAGAFSQVVLARTMDDERRHIAVKVFKIPEKRVQDYKSYINRELSILRTVDHPCVSKLVDYNISKDDVQYLMLKYSPGGNLLEFSKQYYSDNYLSRWYWELISQFTKELMEAMRYLHSNGVIHRDIKLENILLSVDPETLVASRKNDEFPETRYSGQPLISIIDFGLSKRVLNDDEELSTRCGSLDYTSPELLMGLNYNGQLTDSWSCGVVIYSLLENRLPFDPPPLSPLIEGSNVISPSVMKRQRQRNRTPHRIAMVDWAWFTTSNLNAFDPECQQWISRLQKLTEMFLVRKQNRSKVRDVIQMPDFQWLNDVN